MKHVVHTARNSFPRDRVEEVVIDGPAGPMLLDEVTQRRATLVAVGSHGSRRITGILLGGVATLMLHKAPCSVLITRHPQAGDGQFRSIVVGTDGSAESCAAVRVASQLGDDLAVEVTAVIAGKNAINESLASSLTRPDGGQITLRKESGSAVSVLAKSDADLLIVGSRGSPECERSAASVNALPTRRGAPFWSSVSPISPDADRYDEELRMARP